MWDYGQDKYTRRLLRTATAGKVVPVVAATDAGDPALDDEEVLDAMALEYTYRLSSQLEEARQSHQLRLQAVEDAARARIDAARARRDIVAAEARALAAEVAAM